MNKLLFPGLWIICLICTGPLMLMLLCIPFAVKRTNDIWVCAVVFPSISSTREGNYYANDQVDPLLMVAVVLYKVYFDGVGVKPRTFGHCFANYSVIRRAKGCGGLLLFCLFTFALKKIAYICVVQIDTLYVH